MKTRALALVAGLLAAACATLPPEQAERNALVIKAARACQVSHPTVVINGVDQWGRLEATYQASSDWAGFSKCFQTEASRLLGTTEIGGGRLVVPSAGPISTTVPLELSGNAMLVKALIDGTHPVTLLLDTGAGLTIVRPQALAAAGIEVPKTAPKMMGTVVGGRIVDMPYLRLRSLRVGDATVEGIDVAAYDATPQRRDVDGLLGANFLNHFKVTIDRGARQVTLVPPLVSATAVGAGGADRVWNAPTWMAGDEWHVQWRSPTGNGAFTRTVEGEEVVDGLPHWILKSGASRIYFVKPKLAWHFEKRGDATVLRRVPPIGYDWPLRVGKSWVLEYRREEPATSRSEPIYRKCEAAGEATVTVPAGAFTTLHVVCKDRAERVISEQWWAAEAKYWVRERTVLASGERWQELASYRVRTAPVARRD